MTTKRILVIDDEPNIVKSCTRMLELEGFEVRGVTGGAEAIALYKSEGFDLVLVDLKMPGVDGLEVLAALREYDPSAAVVIVTAYGTKESVVEALRLGACEFLEKPLEAKTLIATVRRILERENGAVVRGNLRTLSLPNIVQINCTEREQGCLRLKHRGQEGIIFFAGGDVMHAALGSLVGEEAVYELLTWEGGDFELEMGVLPPERTVTTGWSGLLMEGIRRIDERAAGYADDEADGEADSADIDWGGRPILTLASKVSEQIGHCLGQLLAKIDGRCVLMAYRSGRLLHWQGQIDKSHAISLAALVAGSFSATAEIAGVLRNEGETRRFRQSLQESEDFNIYSVAVDDELVLSISFNDHVPLGLVRVYTLKAAGEVQEVLAKDTVEETGNLLDEGLRQEVGDALDALFDDSAW